MFDSQAHGQRFGWLRMAILMDKNCTGFQSKMLGGSTDLQVRGVLHCDGMQCNSTWCMHRHKMT